MNERAQSLVGGALARDRATRTPAQVEADLRSVIELASREALAEGADHGARCRLAAVDDRGDEAGGGRGQAAAARLDDAARGRRTGSPPTCRNTASSTTATSGSRCAPSSARSTARSARAAPGCSSRTRICATTGMNTDSLADVRTIGGAGDHARLSDGRARDRRPRQPGDAEHLRGDVQAASGEERQGAAVADRARAAHQRRRHPALRPARRDRVDAGHPRDVGRAVRARAPRAEARRRRRLRLAEADASRAR